MKKVFKIGLLAISLLFYCPFFANAEEKPNFWSQKIPVNTREYIEIEHEFTSFSLEMPIETEVFAQSDQDPLWYEIEADHDHESAFSELYFVQEDTAKKLRIRIDDGNAPDFINVHFYNTSDEINPVFLAGPVRKIGNLEVISRSEWGADEDFRFVDDEVVTEDVSEKEAGGSAYERAKECGVIKDVHPEEFEIDYIKKTDGGKSLRWPYQYSKRIFKVVIHHTAENNVQNGRSPKEVLRGIYSYHANSKGWGDIGYHFIIDPYGNIYEGRAGGDYVIGGHVYCNNVGTIGVSLMGNFQETEPTDAQIKALQKLLPQLALTYELDLTATEEFHGKSLSNLVGHRDLRATACPGENMYSLLPDIRKAIENAEEIIITKSFKYAAELAQKISLLEMSAGDKQEITLKFKNTGNVIWDRSTWLYVFQPRTGGVSVNPAIKGRSYVAAKMNEAKVKPGEVASFDVEIETDYRGGLFTLEFTPVVNSKKINSGSVVQPVEVETPSWGAETEELTLLPEYPYPGKRISGSIKLKNTGNTLWKKDHVSLSVFSGRNREEVVATSDFNVAPGKTGKFNFSLAPYDKPGKQVLFFRLLVDDGNMPGAPTFNQVLEIQDPHIEAGYYGDDKIVTYVETDSKSSLSLKFKNTGNVVWEKEDIELFVYGTGMKSQKIKFKGEQVEPGEEANFTYSFTPEYAGNFKFVFLLRGMSQKIAPTVYWFVVSKDEVPERLKRRNTNEVTSTTSKEKEKSTTSAIEEDIRIRLSFPENEAKISSTGQVEVIADNEKIFTLSAGDTITLKKNGNKIFVDKNARDYLVVKIKPTASNSVLEIENWERYPAWTSDQSINDNRFKGMLEARVYDSKFTIINELSFEDYLKGVAEVASGTHFEKKKVMAILARSYAYFYLQPENTKFAGAPFDGSDSPAEFQKYLGYSFTERAGNWLDAVEETSGLAVKYKDKLVKTPYFTQSDGRTLTPAEANWGWSADYLKSVDDPWCEGMERKGHGVGLSGYGAQKMAEEGKTYEEIIKYYYWGVEIGEI